MPDSDKIFGDSLVLGFRKWCRHVKTIYKRTLQGRFTSESSAQAPLTLFSDDDLKLNRLF